MNFYLGVTDYQWFSFLSHIEGIDEVNFWQPGGNRKFGVLAPGEPFLFKLHAPYNAIAGGGFFAHSSLLPVSLAWEAFEQKNGAASFSDMRKAIAKYRKTSDFPYEDYQIGCILLEQPFFFSREQWIPVPPDWSPNIVQGKRYLLDKKPGRSIWQQVQAQLQSRPFIASEYGVHEETGRFGQPLLITPRLGQGSFRVMVTDAYRRRCAVTREKTLPALEAAHIRSYKTDGPHMIQNGILLRSDIHKLFDAGYVTIGADYHFVVSRRIREEFENGRDYYALHGNPIELPPETHQRPNQEFIVWHNENVFRG